VRKADVFVENFRPGGTRRYGIDYERLSAINPQLIYVSVTGFGSSGPDYDRPGLDPLAQAQSGAFAAHSGEHRRAGRNDGDSPRHPIYINLAICDYGGAMLGALACILALRARQVTGMGQHGETSLIHAAMALQAGEFIFYPGRPDLENGAPELRGVAALQRAYQCADGKWLYLSISDATRWEALRGQVPRLAQISFEQARLQEPDSELAAQLGEFFASLPSPQLFETLIARGIPVSPLPHASQLFDDAQVIANELAIDVQDPRLGVVKECAPFVKFAGVTPAATPAPQLGEHSDEVLAELLGYDAARIAKLRAEGVIFG
jgi:crotonobetainyl-CoA:carnitine CoA-transferase CaiB-like acyl-CoA transferase